MDEHELKIWARFYDRLAEATLEAYRKGGLWHDFDSRSIVGLASVVSTDLVEELNYLVYESLGLKRKDRALVHDLMRVRLALNDGQLGDEAVRRPTKGEMRTYGVTLQAELDNYIRGELSGRHDIEVLHDDHSAMVRMSLIRNGAAKGQVSVMRADDPEATALEKCREHIRQQRSQWVYFDRNLRIYKGGRTYTLKPMQRFQWTETQARIDATDIIAESIARREET